MSKKINKEIKIRTFEECLDIINTEIEKRRPKWTLTAVPHISFEDVAQNLRLHIWKKWNLYDQSKPLLSWLNTVISNQIINMIRNWYGNFSRPCLKCQFNGGGDLCTKFDIQCTKCELYRTWVYGKKSAHDVKLPVSMEDHSNEVYDVKTNHIDVEKTAQNIHEKMKKVLRPSEYKIYDLLFIQHKSREEVGKLMEYKSCEKKRVPGYKQIANIEKQILAKVKECLAGDEIEIIMM